MTSSIVALVKTIRDCFKYNNSRPRYVFGKFTWRNQFLLNRMAVRNRFRKYRCGIPTCIIIAIVAFLVGLSTLRKPDACIYNQTFDRWECCKEIINTPNGPQCAVGQTLSILIHP